MSDLIAHAVGAPSVSAYDNQFKAEEVRLTLAKLQMKLEKVLENRGLLTGSEATK